jgi:DNA-binding YbaB/EbfC family protein
VSSTTDRPAENASTGHAKPTVGPAEEAAVNPNYQKMMKQVQKMQADMAKMQDDLATQIVEASAGGGMVTVQVTGAIELKSIKIDPAAVDPEDVEMLEDMIMAATNEALRSAQELANKKMGGLTAGLNIPGLPF